MPPVKPKKLWKAPAPINEYDSELAERKLAAAQVIALPSIATTVDRLAQAMANVQR